MMKECGFPVYKAQSVPLLKDHSKRKAKREKSYPRLPVKKVLFEFTNKDFANIEEWLWGRFKEIEIAEKLSDDELPLCTYEERFNKGDKYAVMKEGRKTALRVLDSKEEAEKWSEKNGKGDYIEVRKGEDVKCIDYCFANQFCNYYHEYVKEDDN